MQSTLYVKTKVLPGKKIEISLPESREGDPVQVFLVFPNAPALAPRSALEIIEDLNGHRLFASPQDVDRYLRDERSSWQP